MAVFEASAVSVCVFSLALGGCAAKVAPVGLMGAYRFEDGRVVSKLWDVAHD